VNKWLERGYLDLAARLAARGGGRVEPGALVGCVIVRTSPGSEDRIIGMGHYRAVGRLHAEAEALANCRARGEDPAGATVFVTLEPCAKPGRNPPCAQALMAAKIGRVVYAASDPNPLKAGGALALHEAGIECTQSSASELAVRASEPFRKRITTGLPWVIAKWAQTVDGKIATRTGASQWISGERSRRLVHHLRARVDAIITGIGTVLADDPLLTARNVPIRRTAIRVVVDNSLRTPITSKLVQTANSTPCLIATTARTLEGRRAQASALESAGARIAAIASVRPGNSPPGIALPGNSSLIDLRSLLLHLATVEHVHTVMLESGPTLMGAFFEAGLVDEAHVYVGPLLMGDAEAPGPWTATNDEFAPLTLTDARRMHLLSVRRVGPDVRMVYRATPPPPSA